MGKNMGPMGPLKKHPPNMGVDPYDDKGQPRTNESIAAEILASCSPSVQDCLYRSVWFDRVCEDIDSRAEDIGYGDITAEEIQYAASRYVYDGKYDCNLSYWDNIDNVIELAVSALDGDSLPEDDEDVNTDS